MEIAMSSAALPRRLQAAHHNAILVHICTAEMSHFGVGVEA